MNTFKEMFWDFGLSRFYIFPVNGLFYLENAKQIPEYDEFSLKNLD